MYWYCTNRAGIGQGTAWVDVTASRSLNTIYTNYSGRPLEVIVGISSGAAALVVNATIDSVAIGGWSDGVTTTSSTSVHLTVPPGSTYRVTGQILVRWAEA